MIVFLKYFTSSKITKNNKKSTTKYSEYKKICPLQIEKNFIRCLKDVEIIILKGITTQLFGYHYYSMDKFWQISKILKKWNINLIGVFITPAAIDEKIKI